MSISLFTNQRDNLCVPVKNFHFDNTTYFLDADSVIRVDTDVFKTVNNDQEESRFL